MDAPSHLRSLQALELAARLGSLKAAAEALLITPAAVGQRIKALEDYLGADLLVRGRSGLKPTAQLKAALPHLLSGFRELEQATRALDLQRAHEIHIAAPSDFAELWLIPRLAAFRAAHPNVRFCVNGEGDAPLRLGAADCEVRFRALDNSASQDLLFHDVIAVISSPENRRRTALLPKRERLEGFPLLHLDFYKDDPAAPDWKRWFKAQNMTRTAPERGMRFQRISLAVEAVLADAGPALCGLALIAPLLESGELTLPFPKTTSTHTSHAFLCRWRADSVTRPQMRRFRDWLLGEADKTREWLSGTKRLPES
jgi:LysR family transcriptional regulator, glycine cleavage system transcriptional activator